MSEIHHQPYSYQPYQYQGHYRHQYDDNRINQLVKAITPVTAGGSLLILSGLVLAATVIGLTIATPLFVIFSPVLVPAVITAALISLGFLASGGFGVAAITVLAWIYRYVTGKHPAVADQFDSARDRLLNKAREFNDYGQQQMGGEHGGQGS